MAGRGDLAGVLRGLSLIRQALIETQGKEVQQMWKNSSLRTAAEQASMKIQERASTGPSVNLGDIPVIIYN